MFNKIKLKLAAVLSLCILLALNGCGEKSSEDAKRIIKEALSSDFSNVTVNIESENVMTITKVGNKITDSNGNELDSDLFGYKTADANINSDITVNIDGNVSHTKATQVNTMLNNTETVSMDAYTDGNIQYVHYTNSDESNDSDWIKSDYDNTTDLSEASLIDIDDIEDIKCTRKGAEYTITGTILGKYLNKTDEFDSDILDAIKDQKFDLEFKITNSNEIEEISLEYTGDLKVGDESNGYKMVLKQLKYSIQYSEFGTTKVEIPETVINNAKDSSEVDTDKDKSPANSDSDSKVSSINAETNGVKTGAIEFDSFLIDLPYNCYGITKQVNSLDALLVTNKSQDEGMIIFKYEAKDQNNENFEKNSVEALNGSLNETKFSEDILGKTLDTDNYKIQCMLVDNSIIFTVGSNESNIVYTLVDYNDSKTYTAKKYDLKVILRSFLSDISGQDEIATVNFYIDGLFDPDEKLCKSLFGVDHINYEEIKDYIDATLTKDLAKALVKYISNYDYDGFVDQIKQWKYMSEDEKTACIMISELGVCSTDDLVAYGASQDDIDNILNK